MSDLHLLKPTKVLVKAARREDATGEQTMEAIWIAAEMLPGAAWALSLKAVELLDDIWTREA